MTKYGQVPDATRSWYGLNAVPDEVLIVRSNNGTLWRRTPGGQSSGDWQYQAHPGGMWRDAVPRGYEPDEQPFHEILFPTLETPRGESVNVNVHGSSPDMAESLRRSAERVMAMHGGRGPQQYKTGGVEINVTRWDQLGPAQPITMHGTPGMYLAPEITGYKDHLIVLTEHDETGAFLYQYRPGTSTDVPEGLATAGPSLCDTRHLGWVHPFDR